MTRPIVLVTRPAASAQRFVDALKTGLPDQFDTIVSPVQRIEPANCVIPNADHYIFTSANGVAQVVQGATDPAILTKTAYCVGDRTALTAREAGFQALSAQGSAKELIALILLADPDGDLLHVRGEHSRGNLAEHLRDAGLHVREIIAYRQIEQELSPQAIQALGGERPVILPLFSPRSAHILSKAGPFAAPLSIIAMSEAVADAAKEIPCSRVTISDLKTENMMINAVETEIGRFVLEEQQVRPHMNGVSIESQPARPGGIIEEGGTVANSADETNTPDPVDEKDIVDTATDAVEETQKQADTAEESSEAETPDAGDHDDADPSQEDEATDDPNDHDADQDEIDDLVDEDVATTTDPAPEIVKETVIERKGGFVPMLLGGLVAGGIGYGVAMYQNPDDGTDLAALVAAQAEQIAALDSQIADLPAAPDLTGLETAAQQAGDQIAAVEMQVADGLAVLEQRLADLEKAPSSDGTLSQAAIAAYEREVAQMRVQVENALELASQAHAAQEASDQMTAEAARDVTARAALGRVQAALETGAPFEAALSDVMANSDIEIPAALADIATDGAPSVAALKETFPEAARAALDAARAEGVDENAGGLGGFLRGQFEVRSVEPREGSSPDAVLSRAEAALKEGRLSDAIAETESLPEVVRAEMSAFLALAQLRIDALAAAQSLSQSLNEN
ncbi:uroporphyrinogen-III synthase [Aestuariibius sp. HNIBRBA575]|uniref:uroporphyrinogen-III synthase n=1 Tax=Aestuariibius sp. HNIBRBA575 TaxID=3233343 RepID=UPI0034A4A035